MVEGSLQFSSLIPNRAKRTACEYLHLGNMCNDVSISFPHRTPAGTPLTDRFAFVGNISLNIPHPRNNSLSATGTIHHDIKLFL